MNFIFTSPHFPSNFAGFCTALNEKGVTVLGIGDESYENLSREIKGALTEYYCVDSMENYEEMYRACGYFAHKYGKIDRIESHNEHWLETDAQLRTDFNVPGLKVGDMQRVKYKSRMKEVFRKAGVRVADGRVVHNLEEALAFAGEIGFPVVVKPDNGVGASATYKLSNTAEIENFYATEPAKQCIMEAFIQGTIHTYDGLTDQDGKIVFSSSLSYSTGIMEAVNDNLDLTYCIPRKLPQKIVDAGKRSVKAFELKERFFHLEFFLTDAGDVYALEINVRPPGGLTVDMFNYANDIDIFRQYANVVTENRFTDVVKRPYHCIYIGRKNVYAYRNTVEGAVNRFSERIVHHGPIASAFSAAIGDYGFIVRAPGVKSAEEVVRYVMEKA